MSQRSDRVRAVDEHALPLRARPDLRIERHTHRNAPSWVVHDPIALRTYQLGPYERFLLEHLDGQTSLAELKRRFDRHFVPQRLPMLQLQAFLQMMHREGLLLAETKGQGQQLWLRRSEVLSKQRWSRALNLLAIRFPGVNPTAILHPLERRTRWIFTPAFAIAALTLLLLAIAILVTAAARGELPDAARLLSWRAGLGVLAAIGLAKVLHELGHALTCVHLGGRCQEMGLMLLVFAPCLYCDVSSSVLMRNKWHRILVTAAGMLVEILIASSAIVLWYWSQPGPLRDFFFLLAVVCSINTLLINGNPLLRFDGYYLLADYLEIPNLQSVASQYTRGLVRRLLFGPRAEAAERPPGVPAAALIAYAVLSSVYRLLIVLAIVGTVYAVLVPLHMMALAHGVVAILLVNMFLLPRWPSLVSAARPLSGRAAGWPRAVLAGVLVAALSFAVLAVPWPHRLRLTAHVQSQDAQRVYVTVPGILKTCVGEGERVAKGQPLATLENLELELQIAQLQSQWREQQQHVEDLRRVQGNQPGAAEQLPTAETSLDEIQHRLQKRIADRDRLVLRAPQAGTVLPAKDRPADEPQDDLDRMDGRPTDAHNLQRYLEVGTPLCEIGSPELLAAYALVSARDVGRLEPGQPVVLRFRQWPEERLNGHVDQIAAVDRPAPNEAGEAESTSPSLSKQTTRPDASTHGVPMYYEVRIGLQAKESPLRLGARGVARVTVRAESVGQRLWRYLRSRFAIGL